VKRKQIHTILCQEELFSIDRNAFKPYQTSYKNLSVWRVYHILSIEYTHANDFCTPREQQDIP